jgi:hypothetical protein
LFNVFADFQGKSFKNLNLGFQRGRKGRKEGRSREKRRKKWINRTKIGRFESFFLAGSA